MGYSINEGKVRADRFKPSGKWYDTIALDMTGFYNILDIHKAAAAAYKDANYSLDEGWFIVILEPYHQHSHPIVIRSEDL